MNVTSKKNCYCHRCKKYFHYLGIASHRSVHKKNKENCKITYSNGDTYEHKYSEGKGFNRRLF